MNLSRTMLVALACFALSGAAHADAKSKVAQEVAESMLARFGAKAGTSGTAALAQGIEVCVARHGDDALTALRKVGPSAFGLIEAAGTDGAKVARLLAQHGEAGATRVLQSPKGMSQFLRYGEEAGEVLIRHPGVAEELVERGGMPAVKALAAVSPQNGRRIAILLEGELGQLGKHQELLDVIGRYGDRAANFVWDNAGALSVAATLTAFLVDPEPFLDGVKEVSKSVGETAVKPLAEASTEAVKGIVAGTNWTTVIVVGLGIATLIVLVRSGGIATALAAWRRARARTGLPSQQPATAKGESDGKFE